MSVCVTILHAALSFCMNEVCFQVLSNETFVGFNLLVTVSILMTRSKCDLQSQPPRHRIV